MYLKRTSSWMFYWNISKDFRSSYFFSKNLINLFSRTATDAPGLINKKF